MIRLPPCSDPDIWRHASQTGEFQRAVVATEVNLGVLWQRHVARDVPYRALLLPIRATARQQADRRYGMSFSDLWCKRHKAGVQQR